MLNLNKRIMYLEVSKSKNKKLKVQTSIVKFYLDKHE